MSNTSTSNRQPTCPMNFTDHVPPFTEKEESLTLEFMDGSSITSIRTKTETVRSSRSPERPMKPLKDLIENTQKEISEDVFRIPSQNTDSIKKFKDELDEMLAPVNKPVDLPPVRDPEDYKISDSNSLLFSSPSSDSSVTEKFPLFVQQSQQQPEPGTPYCYITDYFEIIHASYYPQYDSDRMHYLSGNFFSTETEAHCVIEKFLESLPPERRRDLSYYIALE